MSRGHEGIPIHLQASTEHRETAFFRGRTDVRAPGRRASAWTGGGFEGMCGGDRTPVGDVPREEGTHRLLPGGWRANFRRGEW
jgi:hypothetical protein